jgi:hypothetical protein
MRLLALAFVLSVALGAGDAAVPIAVVPSGELNDDSALPAHADPVGDYTLTATLDPGTHVIHGEGTIVWRNTSRTAVRELWVHLYLNAFKNKSSVWMRDLVGGFRGTHGLKDFGHVDVTRFKLKEDDVDLWKTVEMKRPGDDDETDARVPLPRDVAPGEKITIEVAFDSKLPSVLERTGYEGSFHFAGQWFPKIARLESDGTWAHFPFHHLSEFYADFGTFDVTVDVPEAFVIGATGPAMSSNVAGGRRVERHVQNDVHDFAFTAWDKWQTQSETIDGVLVTMLYPPGYRVAAQRELAAMRFALPYFGARYGKYPYGVLTVVHPPQSAREAGGMEYPTLITTGGPWYGPPGFFGLELVTIHEFGHQYFYGLVATDEMKWPFLDEGLNSYAEADAMRALRGPASALDMAGLQVSDVSYRAVTSNRAAHDEVVAQPAHEFDTGGAYGNLVYSRTSAIMETMRRVYGDALVTRALGRYARRYRFQHPGPPEFFATMGEVMGPRAAATLKTALTEKGWVDYVVTTVPRTTDEGVVVVTRRGTLSFPVDLELTYEDGRTERVKWEGVEEAFKQPYRGRLRGVVVDPDRKVIIDQDLTNNHHTVPGMTGGGAPRTLERALYWAQVWVQGISP